MQKYLIIFISLFILIGCTSTPDNVISDGDMVDLMVDIHKAEAMMDMNGAKYYNDSLKLVLKQSVLSEHGYTLAQFDTSLVWYAHHIDRYTKVYDKVIRELENEKKDLDNAKDEAPVKTEVKKEVRKRYTATGDTADIWTKNRTWIISPKYGKTFITYNYKPATQNKMGDAYELAFKLNNVSSPINIFIGLDYINGSTSYIYRTSSYDGWNKYKIQGDSTKTIRRVYGYISVGNVTTGPVYIDSVELVRTHFDRMVYPLINSQKYISGDSKNDKKQKPDNNAKLVPPTINGEDVRSRSRVGRM